MSLTPDAQAIMLLTVRFPKSGGDSAKPLTTNEWARLNKWLLEKDANFKPSDLMTGNLSQWVEGWSHKRITCERIEALLNRGMTLALSVEKWERSGLWVMTRSDDDYPQRIKERLGPGKSPHILFGFGNRKLLEDDGNVLAVVGSRDADDTDLAYSRSLGRKAANSGWSVVSGGARGVDEAAMLGALDAEGTVIGVLADSLLKTSLSKKYLNHLLDDNLVLVSPFNPEAGFSVGNAMGRNKYIYCLSDAAVVVRSDTKGGTWRGAEENQKNNWVPIWVKHTDDGNHRIVQRGAKWLPQIIDEVNFSTLVEAPKATPESVAPSTDNGASPASGISGMDFYDFFLLKAEQECSDSPKTVDQLHGKWQFHKTQLTKWLKKATEDKKMDQLDDTQGYRWILSTEHEMQTVSSSTPNSELPEQGTLDMLESSVTLTPSQATHDQSQTQPAAKSA